MLGWLAGLAWQCVDVLAGCVACLAQRSLHIAKLHAMRSCKASELVIRHKDFLGFPMIVLWFSYDFTMIVLGN